MSNLFETPLLASGYATARPAVHPLVIDRIKIHLEIEKPLHRAVDIGCGAGLSTQPLRLLATTCVGIEPGESMLKWHRQIAPEASFVVGYGESLPFRSHSVDLMTAAGSLNYTKDLDAFFREALRTLTSDGTLVVYDFSPGRRFLDTPELEHWFKEFRKRYPVPNDGARPLDPETLLSLANGFRSRGHEHFEVGLLLDAEFYVNYMMTETNVGAAIREGKPAPAIRKWCIETVTPLFAGTSQEVIFEGYISYLAVK